MCRVLTNHNRFFGHYAIGNYIDRHNENPEPFIWTARASDVLEKVKRARRTFKRHSA